MKNVFSVINEWLATSHCLALPGWAIVIPILAAALFVLLLIRYVLTWGTGKW